MQPLFMVFRAWVGFSFTRLRRGSLHLVVWLASILCAVGIFGCTSTSTLLPPRLIPSEKVRPLCWSPPELGTPGVPEKRKHFVFTDNGDVLQEDQPGFWAEVDQGAFIFQFVEDAPTESTDLVPLNRPDAWCNIVPRPTDPKVLRLLDPCAVPTSMQQGPSATKNLLGQTEVSVRSPLLCNKPPRLTPTAQETILLRARNRAYLNAYQTAYTTGMALTQAEADMQWVINKSNWSLKQFFIKDPGTLEQIQQRVTDALNLAEAPPEYGDPELDGLAYSGFMAGFDNGNFEVEAKLFAIDAGIMILELAALEVAMGPLGGAKFLASAVSKSGRALTAAAGRLENVPIFLPGAAGGIGGVTRVGTVINALRRGSSKKLAENLAAAGFQRPEGADAHHIVALGHRLAAKSREILTQFGVKLDEAVNGVFLPSNMKSPNVKGAIVHATLANNHKYYAHVEEFLKNAHSRAEVIHQLKRIRETLLNGTFYDAIP